MITPMNATTESMPVENVWRSANFSDRLTEGVAPSQASLTALKHATNAIRNVTNSST